MTNLQKKVTTGIASVALLASLATPAFADITIQGNGSSSNNDATMNSSSNLNVTQKNSSNVNVEVDINQNTGGNTANGNTGNGDVRVNTGNANAEVDVKVGGNSNVARITGCNECEDESDITIKGNGAKSNNDATVNNSSNKNLNQKNSLNADVCVASTQKTGLNKTNNNTGNGSKVTKTGKAKIAVAVEVKGNKNKAVLK